MRRLLPGLMALALIASASWAQAAPAAQAIAPVAATPPNPGLALKPPPVPEASATPQLEWVFTEVVTVANNGGPRAGTTYLGRRNVIPITGGTFAGPNIKGVIVPGGWDYQAARPDGCNTVSANYWLQTDDGVVINIINNGLSCALEGGGRTIQRTTPSFEAPIGKYDWLNKYTYVGTLTQSADYPGAVLISVYRVK